VTMPTRMHGKYGRRTPVGGRPTIRFADIIRYAAKDGQYAPVHPVAEDYLAAMGGGWQMLGNDVAGDCCAVTWANIRRLVTTTLSTPNYPSQAEVWQIYETQNPGFNPEGSSDTDGPGSSYDNGMDIQTLLEYLNDNEGPDGAKVVAFASVDYTRQSEVDAAIACLGSVWTGVNVLQCNEQQFDENLPWSIVPGSPVVGGHSIITGGYSRADVYSGALAGSAKFITWAEETSFEQSYWSHYVEECWAVIWPEHLGTESFEAGIDEEQLQTEYEDITGKTYNE
jgi:hypothetical protein